MNRLSLGRVERSFGKLLLLQSTPLVVGAIGLLVVNEYVLRVRYGVPPVIPYVLYWLVLAGVFTCLALGPWQRYRRNIEELMVQAFAVGLALGFAVAVYKAYAHWQLWTVFNLLAEPMRTGLFGLLVAWVVDRKRFITFGTTP